MRITNRMMTNDMLSNINNNKINMSRLEEQYASGKKIQRPSDDPIVAVRALRLRSNMTALEQYNGKNIPDAQSWMDVTEGSLKNVNNVLKQINTYCVQGSSDTLQASERSDIIANLTKMKEQIYEEGNTTYAGRYVFTGYKTDSSLTFTDDVSNLSYDIKENITGKDIQVVSKVTGSCDPATYASTDPAPKMVDAYRIQLSYDRIKSMGSVSYKVGNTTSTLSVETISVKDKNAYLPGDAQAHFIPETGELILGKDAYTAMQNADSIEMNYTKDNFKDGDVKPEHYFDCKVTDSNKAVGDPDRVITYTKKDQKIQYEINVSQELTVNTQASDAFSLKIGRDIDTIQNSVNDVIATEDKLKEVENRLKDTSLSDTDKKKYQDMQTQLNLELGLKKTVMQKTFENGNRSSQNEQETVNTALADLGSRDNRLKLTENRLSSQKVDFTDLLAKNEDVDLVDTIIKYSSASALYNASLSAASKIVKSSLLDFL